MDVLVLNERELLDAGLSRSTVAALRNIQRVTGTSPDDPTLADSTDSLSSDIDSLETRMDTAEGDIDDAEGEIVSLTARVGTTEGDISSLQSDVGDLQNDKEDKTNKVSSISGASTNIQYPGAKLVYDELSLKVPYSGATSSVDLGSYGIDAGSSSFGDDTNYTDFDTSGHQTMAGNARPWRDELGDALSLRSTGTGVSQNNTENTVDFTAGAVAANDYLFLNVQLNHDKDLASSVSPHIHFFQANNNAPNFILYYRWQVDGGIKTTAWTPLKCNTLAFPYTTGTTLNQIAYSLPITVPVGTTLSDILQFRIARDTANVSTLFTGADPYTGTVGIMAFDVHFMINSIGSKGEYSK